jgi:hypothetical protein
MKIESLHLVACTAAQERLLLGGLDTFGDDGHAEARGEREDGIGDRQIRRALGDPSDEGAIEFQRVDRKALEL